MGLLEAGFHRTDRGVSHIDEGGVAYWTSVSYCNDQKVHSRQTSSQKTRL